MIVIKSRNRIKVVRCQGFYFIQKKRHRTLRKIWPPSYYWFYKIWQKKAYALAEKLDKKENFDVIHQLNMVGYREPGFLWKIDKPFVWGPIGGTQNVPWHLFAVLNAYGKLFYGGRNVINTIQKHFLSRPKLAAKKNQSTLIAATPDIKKDIKKLWGRNSEIITEVGANNFLNITPSHRNDYPTNADELSPKKVYLVLSHSRQNLRSIYTLHKILFL